MNWKSVIKVTGTLTAIALFFIALLFLAFSEFRYDQPLLVNDLGSTVLLEQQEFHIQIDRKNSIQLKLIGAAIALATVFLMAASLAGEKSEKTSTP